MRILPIGIPALLAIFVPAIVPMVVVAAIKIPLVDLLLKLLHTVGQLGSPFIAAQHGERPPARAAHRA